jgi:hypothetical protein
MDIGKARQYYLRKDIQAALLDFSKNREMAFNFNGRFGKRPDTLEYENDFRVLIENGITSFHCSEELWKNPLELKTEMNPEQMNNLRSGWDLIIDIDSKFLDYSKIAAKLIISALKFHNITSIGLKYSGNKGFHIAVPWEAFPKEIDNVLTEKLFPDLPRKITGYLKEFIRNKLIEEIGKFSQQSAYIKGKEKVGDFAEDVMPDLVLVSPRHLFRAPYSLNEKSGFASIVIKPEQLDEFHPGWAKPERVIPKPFLPQAKKDEAKELVIQALDWDRKNDQVQRANNANAKQFKRTDFVIKDASPEVYPPCIKCISAGIKQDGRKRALFILLNFFRSINMPESEIREKVNQWNKANYQPLREGYVLSQISWTMKHKAMLPPNCENARYKELAVCQPDFFCKKIKNPVNYIIVKNRAKIQGSSCRSSSTCSERSAGSAYKAKKPLKTKGKDFKHISP